MTVCQGSIVREGSFVVQTANTLERALELSKILSASEMVFVQQHLGD
jgi:hypothetical protein